MLRHRFYYLIKPYVPWSLRIAIRRISARRVLRASGNVWPILSSAARQPPAWRGWPEGRKFAFVLTHDVEGPEGVARSQATAELEIAHGFRSSFNFIPEGDYSVSPQLREWLVERGFEIGVHDLCHDGKLFASREEFPRKAARINRYLSEWGARGFRAGFMLRQLEWYRHLNILYDASTFDTDPFEFQPDGANTIFPYWYTHRGGASYVELPYTLVQDSTLFLLLQEQSIDIWKRKLDWVAEHGGMAMVIVHPDYLGFDGQSPSKRTFPVRFYSELLQYVSSKYAGQYWQPLPRQVAEWYQAEYPLDLVSSPPPGAAASAHAVRHPGLSALRGKRAAVLLYSNYPADPRPRRAAEALIDAGMEVDLLCLSDKDGEPLQEEVNGVNVFRLPMQRRRDSRLAYFWQYGRFLLSAFWFLASRAFSRKYDLVHVHNMPDILVFGSMVPKLLGARVVLDLHDPMPELMTTIYGSGPDSTPIRLLRLLEKWSIAFADSVITVNEACKRLFSQRSCAEEKVNVIMNSPDERIFPFRPQPEASPDARPEGSRFAVMYHGSLVERHGLDLAVEALRKIRPAITGAELWVFGQDTPFLQQVMSGVATSEVREAVQWRGRKKLEDIVEAIRACDVGVIPNRRSIFTELNTPTRIFEYLSQGKPVIAPRAPGILDYFGPDDLVYFELGDADDLARKLEFVHRNPVEVAAIVRRGQDVYRTHCWSSERRRFEGLVASLLTGEAAREDPVVELTPDATKG